MPTHLAPPEIAMPVSPHSTHITLSGQLENARVIVWGSKHNTPIVDDVALYPHQTFAVKRAPIAGEQLWSQQVFGNSLSDQTPNPRSTVMNDANEGDLLPLGVVSHPWICGECFWLDGAYPGATVSLYSG